MSQSTDKKAPKKAEPDNTANLYKRVTIRSLKCIVCREPATQLILKEWNNYVNFFCDKHIEESFNELKAVYKTVECLNCQTAFQKKYIKHVYCNSKCRDEFWNKQGPRATKEKKKEYQERRKELRQKRRQEQKTTCSVCHKIFNTYGSGFFTCPKCISSKKFQAKLTRIDTRKAAYLETLPKHSDDFVKQLVDEEFTKSLESA